jgi:hypothetical protein
MRMDAHLTADELRVFARHESSATDVRRIARHLEVCEECRVTGILGVDEEHLTFEQLATIADGGPGDEHVRRCATCARELADLRQFCERRAGFSPPLPGGGGLKPRPTFAWLSAAAVILIALAGGAFFTARNDARLAEVALPAEVLAMQSRRLSFRGVEGNTALDVIEPRDTVVMTSRPLFRWNAPPGTTSVVEVFAPDFKRVAVSPPLTSHTWTPPVALQRGVTYRWQVTAGDTIIPSPPLPEALFLVVPEDRAKAVRDLERSAERPSLELASAYARAGDFDRARAELRALIGRGKQTRVAERLLRRIDGVPH